MEPRPAPPSFDRVPEAWSAVADAYENTVQPYTGLYAQDALRLVPTGPGRHVLDVACGPGTLSLLAARAGARVTATDFAPEMVERLRRRAAAEGLDHVRAEVMDGQALALPDATFDAAHSVFGLIFFPDRARGFRELLRVLKPGARAAVTAWGPPSANHSFRIVQQAVQDALPDLPPAPEPPAILSLSDPARFAAEMEAAGFHDVTITTVTHEWEHPSAAAFWDKQARVSPVFRNLEARAGPQGMQRVRARALALLEQRFGAGPVRLPGQAFVGVGRRPDAEGAA